MVKIVSQSDSRRIRDLSFCYICGRTFQPADQTNHDHVPPEGIFAKEDRNFPIKLKTHVNDCHAPLNLDDEVFGQLVALLHGKIPDDRNDKLNIQVARDPNTGRTSGIFRERNLEFLMRRWIQGFHAALYQSHLPASARWAIQTPFPSGSISASGVSATPIREQHYEFVTCIKQNRAAGNVDMIVANNGKLRYECVWDRLSDGSHCCIFALDLYGWADLGDINNFARRGCAGCYSGATLSTPSMAATATDLVFDLNQKDRADPFAE